MKRFTILFLAAIATQVFAGAAAAMTFDERVSLAKAAEDDERFHPYPGTMLKQARRHIARTMRRCQLSASGQDGKAFVLVADILADGRPVDVDVKPANAVGKCFAAGFSTGHYLPPPAYPGRDGFPVMLRIGGRQ